MLRVCIGVELGYDGEVWVGRGEAGQGMVIIKNSFRSFEVVKQ